MGACCSARSRSRTKPSIDARCKRIVLTMMMLLPLQAKNMYATNHDVLIIDNQ